jgi:hypothetical protein
VPAEDRAVVVFQDARLPPERAPESEYGLRASAASGPIRSRPLSIVSSSLLARRIRAIRRRSQRVALGRALPHSSLVVVRWLLASLMPNVDEVPPYLDSFGSANVNFTQPRIR